MNHFARLIHDGQQEAERKGLATWPCSRPSSPPKAAPSARCELTPSWFRRSTKIEMSGLTNVLVLGKEDQRLTEAFAALTGEDGERHPPFRWQKRLLRRLLDADLPKVVDVPTGLGKTSVMALWRKASLVLESAAQGC